MKDLTKFKPVRIGSKYVVKYEKFHRPVYLGTSSKGIIFECGIEFAKELDTIQEAIDLSYNYVSGDSFRGN